MGYLIKEVKDNFKRYKLANQICIWSITMTMLITGIFLLFAENMGRFIDGLIESVEIEAFLKDGLDSIKISQLKNKISKIPNVKAIEYTSKEEALVEFTRDSDLRKQIEFIGENPLPASFGIKLYVESSELMTGVVKEIEKLDYVDEVRYGREEVNSIMNFVNIIKFSGLVFIVIIGVMTLTIIGYTIYLAISLRGQEIRVMKLVGATSWFVRLPFMLEGAIQGFAGGVLASGLLYVVYRIVIMKIEGIVFIPVQYFAGIIATGMVLGIAGNLIGIEKHLMEEES